MSIATEWDERLKRHAAHYSPEFALPTSRLELQYRDLRALVDAALELEKLRAMTPMQRACREMDELAKEAQLQRKPEESPVERVRGAIDEALGPFRDALLETVRRAEFEKMRERCAEECGYSRSAEECAAAIRALEFEP